MTGDEEKAEIANLLGTAAVVIGKYERGDKVPRNVAADLAIRLERKSVQLGGPPPGTSPVFYIKG